MRKTHRHSPGEALDAGLCVSPKDNFLISGGDDCKIKVWSLGALGGGPLAAPRALSALDAEALERSEKMSGVLSELYGQGSEGSGAGLVVKQTVRRGACPCKQSCTRARFPRRRHF